MSSSDQKGLLCILVAASACASSSPELDGGTRDASSSTCVEALDLLIVMQEGGTIEEKQIDFVRALPGFFRLVATGDTNADGVQDTAPITDLHVGVITTSMWAGGFDGFLTPECTSSAGGDGVLVTTANRAGVGIGCSSESRPSYETLGDSSETSTDELAREVTCLAYRGFYGCSLEQPFEAILKALTPSTSPLSFEPPDSPRGRGDGTNAGFLRSDSMLAIVVLLSDDDCSTRDYALFDPASDAYDRSSGICGCCPDALHPIERYVAGMSDLRPSGLEHILFAPIAGVPLDLVPSEGTDAEYEAVLSDPRMQSGEIVCNPPTSGPAAAARRVVQLARALGPSGMVQSVCSVSFDEQVRAIGARILQHACSR